MHAGSCYGMLADREGERERGTRIGSLLHYNSINGPEAALNARSYVGQFASLLTENYRNRNLIRVNTVISRREEQRLFVAGAQTRDSPSLERERERERERSPRIPRQLFAGISSQFPSESTETRLFSTRLSTFSRSSFRVSKRNENRLDRCALLLSGGGNPRCRE